MENNKNNLGSIFNVTSNNQQGGITAGQINFGALQRVITEQDKIVFKENIKKYVKDKTKQITVLAVMGDGEAINLEMEIVAFLKSEGLNVMGGQGMFTNNPKGLIFEINPKNSELEQIIVGRNQ